MKLKCLFPFSYSIVCIIHKTDVYLFPYHEIQLVIYFKCINNMILKFSRISDISFIRKQLHVRTRNCDVDYNESIHCINLFYPCTFHLRENTINHYCLVHPSHFLRSFFVSFLYISLPSK